MKSSWGEGVGGCLRYQTTAPRWQRGEGSGWSGVMWSKVGAWARRWLRGVLCNVSVVWTTDHQSVGVGVACVTGAKTFDREMYLYLRRQGQQGQDAGWPGSAIQVRCLFTGVCGGDSTPEIP